MKRMCAVISGMIMMSCLVLAQSAEPAQPAQSEATAEKATVKKSEKAAPRSDVEIQKCILGKLSNSEKLRSQGFNATVTNGEATLTGTAQNAGSKGGATRIAQSCGASKVTNKISAPAISKPKKADEKSAQSAKKP